VSTLAALAAFPAAALSIWALLHSPLAARLVAAASADRFTSAPVSRESAMTFASVTSRAPSTRRCPERDQPLASALPTFPVPIIAIVTAASLG